MRKTCNKCGIECAVEDFFFRNKAKNYRSPYCKICFQAINNAYRASRKDKIKVIKRREYLKNKDTYLNREMVSKYGITLSEVREMEVKQSNSCYICGKHKKDCFKGLYVDHNHTTGTVRKLLCRQCNSILGFSYENIKVLEKCILYLKEHNIVNNGVIIDL